MTVVAKSENKTRAVCLIAAAAFHAVLLLFLAFDIDLTELIQSAPPEIFKLTTIEELAPPPPPVEETPPIVSTKAPIAQNIVETDDMSTVVYGEGGEKPTTLSVTSSGADYLPAHKISVPPKFDGQELKKRIIYPPIALRSGIEGRVTVELFVDKQGFVRNVVVLKEDPEGFGFSAAAVKAFQGYRADSPAFANGEAVAARYRYPVVFRVN